VSSAIDAPGAAGRASAALAARPRQLSDDFARAAAEPANHTGKG
jgi:hypothetical protein